MKKLLDFKNNKTLLGISIILGLLTIMGMSYAWFSATVKNENGHDQIVKTGTLELTYVDGPEIILSDVRPGTTITKTVYVKNTGTLDAEYDFVWQELSNSIVKDEMVMTISCDLEGTGEKCEGLDNETPIENVKILKNVSIESEKTHKYVVTITFKETNANQNYNQGKDFGGVLGINESKKVTPVSCTFDGELTQGAEFVKGPYTYHYMQKYYIDEEYTGGGVAQRSDADDEYKVIPMSRYTYTPGWTDITEDGWGVALTERTYTDAVTEAPCTTINDKDVVSMSYMFAYSNPSSINLDSFDTSRVTDMSYMFYGNGSSTLDLSNFDTSSVTDMSYMFARTYAFSIDVSNFNTNKVTNMEGMFSNSNSSKLVLSSFDTSNLTNIYAMFKGSYATEIKGLENFNTSKIANMGSLFYGSYAVYLDVSNFDTSNVKYMGYMFGAHNLEEIIGIEKLNTSNVEYMDSMFYGSQIPILDLSNFDTSKVISMRNMFERINTAEIKGLDKWNTSNVTNMEGLFVRSTVGSLDLSGLDTSNITSTKEMFYDSNIPVVKGLENWNTSKVTYMGSMFYNSKMSTIDVSGFDTSNVTGMQYMFDSSAATEIKGLENWNTSKVTSMNYMFNGCKVKELDLSSFDISKVSTISGTVTGSLDYMFKDCSATIGYAKDEATATRFNNSIGIPDTLRFTVKN